MFSTTGDSFQQKNVGEGPRISDMENVKNGDFTINELKKWIVGTVCKIQHVEWLLKI